MCGPCGHEASTYTSPVEVALREKLNLRPARIQCATGYVDRAIGSTSYCYCRDASHALKMLRARHLCPRIDVS
jgi:hypothetical protein